MVELDLWGDGSTGSYMQMLTALGSPYTTGLEDGASTSRFRELGTLTYLAGDPADMAMIEREREVPTRDFASRTWPISENAPVATKCPGAKFSVLTTCSAPVNVTC